VTASKPLRVVGVVPHPERAKALELTRHAARWFQDHGIEVRVLIEEGDPGELRTLGVGVDEFSKGLDVAISLGGDGTMLRTVDLVYECGAAVLGVNVGQLGYLTEVEPAGFDGALAALLAGEYEIDERMMLDVVVGSSGPAAGRWWALNEAVMEKGLDSRVVRLSVEINGTFFTSYAADGVIVATPTGSTAYSFSARGPIVSPRHWCLLLTPVSPHMLFDRSLVLDAEEELRFTVAEERGVLLTLDGRQLGVLEEGDTVTCTAGPKPARMVTFGARDFHQILKTKFGLADR
jgi:NAD+ kinase